MKRKIIVVVSLLLVVAIAATSFVYITAGPTDTRLYASDQSTGEKYPLTFLYAVDVSTGKILTFSPVIGEVSGTGNLKQSDCSVTVENTLTGQTTPCNRVEAGDGDITGDKMPFLTWTDMQDRHQQQFFNTGQVVFITEQPLKQSVNHVLEVIPAAALTSAN